MCVESSSIQVSIHSMPMSHHHHQAANMSEENQIQSKYYHTDGGVELIGKAYLNL